MESVIILFAAWLPSPLPSLRAWTPVLYCDCLLVYGKQIWILPLYIFKAFWRNLFSFFSLFALACVFNWIRCRFLPAC